MIVGVLKPGYNIVEKDLEIAARLKKFRAEIRFQQDDFAGEIGITVHKLSNIEAGRTPLRYDLAWELFKRFDCRPAWLASGDTFQGQQSWKYPPPQTQSLTNRALLRDVAGMVERGEFKEPEKIVSDWQPGGIGDKLLDKLTGLEASGRRWATRAPDDKVKELFESIEKLGEGFIAALPAEPEEKIQARREALAWARVRMANRVRFRSTEKLPLDELRQPVNSLSVPLTLKQLRDRVKTATSASGSKGKLAKSLGVPPSRLSEWLSGTHEPGAEVTLRLLAWVTAWEANQQKSVASVEAPAAPKTPKGLQANEDSTRPKKASPKNARPARRNSS